MVKLLALVVVLAATSVAHADAPLADDSVDPDVATKLSTFGSAIPAAAIGVGTLVWIGGSNNAIRDLGMGIAVGGALTGIVTPSLGQLYSHHYLNATMALRTGGLVVESIGLIFASNGDLGDCADTTGSCHLKARTFGLLASGAVLYLGGMALDVITARSDAHAWNHRNVQLAPTAFRTPSSTVPGVALALTF